MPSPMLTPAEETSGRPRRDLVVLDTPIEFVDKSIEPVRYLFS